MKKLQLCILFSLVLFSAFSQKVYFVYVQTEQEQPFFVKMNEKVYSSSAAGYLILSKLLDSTYSIHIGFPRDKWPEQRFSVTMNKKDHGYLLKNFGEKGWGLFDLQTLTVQMAISGTGSAEGKKENGDVSPFTAILSKAADDPSLKEKVVQPKTEEKKAEPVVKVVKAKEEPKETVITIPVVMPVAKQEPKVEAKSAGIVEAPVTIKEQSAPVTASKPVTKETPVVPAVVIEQPEVKKEQVIAKEESKPVSKPEAAVAINQEQPVKEQVVAVVEQAIPSVTESYKASQVKKWSESSTSEGFGLVYIDNYDNGIKDTIRLFIPNPKPAVVAVKEEPKEEKKFIETVTTDAVKKEESKPVVSPVIVVTTPVNTKCRETATESDFFKLRKFMADAEGDEEMIDAARKYFRTKCFTTEQIKHLGTMFLNDEGKYKFFDAAYNYVSDEENFGSLQTELRDDYYIKRFRAMLRN